MKDRKTKVGYKEAEGPSAGRTAGTTVWGENGLPMVRRYALSTRAQRELD